MVTDNCCGSECWMRNDGETCWGKLEVIDKWEHGDDYTWIHVCEGHAECYPDGGQFKKKDENSMSNVKHIEVGTETKKKFLRERGWGPWYNEDYWVHPKMVDDPTRQDYTNYGLCLNDAYMLELNRAFRVELAEAAKENNMSKQNFTLYEKELVSALKETAGEKVLELTGDREIDLMLHECIKTMSTKGAEYTGGSPDRLNNFRQAGLDVGLPMEKVWYVFFNKHLRALQSYIKNGCQVKSNETIQSRIMDCIVYLFLFHKMTLEIERKQAVKEIDEG